MKYQFENVRAIRSAGISPQDIILIKAEINYSIFHLINGKKLVLAKTLSQCLEMLGDKEFFRPSRSHLINLIHLKRINDGEIIMKNNYRTPISRRRKTDFISSISSH